MYRNKTSNTKTVQKAKKPTTATMHDNHENYHYKRDAEWLYILT